MGPNRRHVFSAQRSRTRSSQVSSLTRSCASPWARRRLQTSSNRSPAAHHLMTSCSTSPTPAPEAAAAGCCEGVALDSADPSAPSCMALKPRTKKAKSAGHTPPCPKFNDFICSSILPYCSSVSSAKVSVRNSTRLERGGVLFARGASGKPAEAVRASVFKAFLGGASSPDTRATSARTAAGPLGEGACAAALSPKPQRRTNASTPPA